MDIDKIIEKRLQDELAVVIQRYHDGDIRNEVETELKTKQLKEKICSIFKWENISGFNYNLYTLGLALTKNATYYAELRKMGNSYYSKERKRAARFMLRLVLFIFTVLSYVYGWSLLEGLKTTHASCTTLSLVYPFSLFAAYAFLGSVPFVICLDYIITVSKKPFYIVIAVLMFAWLVYIVVFLFPALFPQWIVPIGVVALSVLAGACVAYIVTGVCMWICYAIYA